MVGGLLAAAVALKNPESTKETVKAAGDIAGDIVKEVGNTANSAVGSVQNIGNNAPAADPATTDTTAPPAGSGRG